MKVINGAVRYCTRTDQGLKRSRNEDAYLVIENIPAPGYGGSGTGTLFAVADGMSGHTGGGTASSMAVEGLRKHYMNPANTQGSISMSGREENLRDLEKVVLGIHEEISELAERVEKYEYMGTTLSVLLLAGKTAYIAHVGDSRIYRLREGSLEQLTHDDTMAQLSVEMGYLDGEEATGHPLSHTLIQAIGQGVDELQSKKLEIYPGDVFLLCTDGLYDMVSESEIKDILQETADDRDTCEVLVATALENGGRDNVTVIIVRVI